MPKSAESSPPFVAYDARDLEFDNNWDLNGDWKSSPFDTLPRGNSETLWYHTQGEAFSPYPLPDSLADYTGPQRSEDAISPIVQFYDFTAPDGDPSTASNHWTMYIRIWYRLNHTKPKLNTYEQPYERLTLFVEYYDPDEASYFSEDVALIDNNDDTTEYGGKVQLSDIQSTINAETAYIDWFQNPGVPTDGETVTIGSTTYTWRDDVNPNTPYEVEIGLTRDVSMINFAAAINADPDLLDHGYQAGFYSASTPAHPDVEVYEFTAPINLNHRFWLRAKVPGAAGNSITVSESGGSGQWGWVGTSLLQGADAYVDNKALGKWWFEQIVAPNADLQQKIFNSGDAYFGLRMDVEECDDTDYGVGIARFSVEIIRGDVQSNATARGGFGGIPPVPPIFPVELYRSWSNARRWR